MIKSLYAIESVIIRGTKPVLLSYSPLCPIIFLSKLGAKRALVARRKMCPTIKYNIVEFSRSTL